MKFKVFILLNLLSISIFSQEKSQVEQPVVSVEAETVHHLYNDEGFEYVILDNESGTWTVKVYREKYNELQELIEEKYFENRVEAEEFRKSYVNDFHKKYPRPTEVEEEMDEEVAAMPVMDSVIEDYVTEAPNTHLWVAKNSWSRDWEVKYGEWIRKNLGQDYFAKRNIKTDCADVIIGLRWIFARTHSLPVLNTLSGSQKYFGNMSMKKSWRKLSRHPEWEKDQVFLAALEYVMDNTYTRSLQRDSYPIKINNDSLYSGAHHLEFHSQGGHAMIVQNVKVKKGSNGSAQFTIMDSTLPRKVRNLKRKGYHHGLTPEKGSGFLRMRWPVVEDDYWTLENRSSHPLYSEEQYSQEFVAAYGSFAVAIKGNLSGRTKLSINGFRKSLKELKKQLKFRADVVMKGYAACQSINCAPGTSGWQEWSTPVRDNRLLGLVKGVLKVVELHHKKNINLREEWKKFGNHRIKIGNRKWIAVKHMLDIFNEERFGSDPRSSILERWGQ